MGDYVQTEPESRRLETPAGSLNMRLISLTIYEPGDALSRGPTDQS